MAERLFLKAIELDRRFGLAHANLIHHLFWMNQSQEALARSDQALSFLPNDLAILRARAVSLLYLKRHEEAAKQVHNLATLAPRSVQDDWVLAGVELMRGNPMAKNQLVAVIARGPTVLRHIDTARLYGLIDDLRTSAQHLDRAFQGDPSCVSFVAQSEAFAPFRNHPAIQEVVNKHRAP